MGGDRRVQIPGSRSLSGSVAAAVAKLTKGRVLGFFFRLVSKALITLLPRGAAESYLEWARLLTRSNEAITKKMIKEYREVVFFTPLMMDMLLF